ncbi:hypothetical protein DBR06_SOUSAS16510004, partial [Sousa chinensis]
MGNQSSVPSCTPLRCILQNWETVSYAPMSERKYFVVTLHSLSIPWICRTMALNYNTIFQLQLFCKREEKWYELPYVQAFMLLCQ